MRSPFEVEIGYRMTGLDSNVGISLLFGAGLPGGDAGIQDASEIGSTYSRTNGDLFQKIANAASADDWTRMARTSELNAQTFKRLKAATTEAVTAGVRDLTASPFTDDDTPFMVATDFVVGDKILVGVDGTELLLEVSVVSSPNITLVAADPVLATGDNFICENFLPDAPDSQEKQSLLHFNGTDTIKLGDVNWDLADGINLVTGYSAVNGTISSSDTVNSAIEKLDGNQQDLQTLTGEAQGSVDHSTFTGVTIPDDSTTHEALQALETKVEEGASDNQTQETGVTAITTLDTVLVDDVPSSEWEVQMVEDATQANKRFEKIVVMHNGTSSADATSADISVHTKLKLGSSLNAVLTIDFDGAGASQTMRLRVASSTGGVTFSARRTDVTG